MTEAPGSPQSDDDAVVAPVTPRATSRPSWAMTEPQRCRVKACPHVGRWRDGYCPVHVRDIAVTRSPTLEEMFATDVIGGVE